MADNIWNHACSETPIDNCNTSFVTVGLGG